jgi:erythromycin esterase
MTDDTTADDTTAKGTDTRDTPPEVLDGLAAHAVPIETDPGAGTADLVPLDDRLGSARVVGLGEASHGAREMFQVKDRLIRRLVTEHGCRAVVLEANTPEARAIDDYVVHGEGDPAAALAAVYFWTWQVESVCALLEWLRSFNAGRPLADRVRSYGADVQYTGGAVTAVRDFFEAVDPDALDGLRDALATADDDGTGAYHDDDRPARVAAIETVVPALRDRLAEDGEEYADEAGERAVTDARRDLRTLELAADYRRVQQRRAESTGAGGDPDPELVAETLRLRDAAMAENVEWVAERTDGPVAVWAHDDHVCRTAQRPRSADVTAPSLGSHLAERYGPDYLAVGFGAERLGFQAFGPVADGGGEGNEGEDDAEAYALQAWTVDGPLPGTTEAAVAAAADGVAILDLRAATGRDGSDAGPAAAWLSKRRPHLSVGAYYDPATRAAFLTDRVHGEAFDLLCHLPVTERARPLAGVETG